MNPSEELEQRAASAKSLDAERLDDILTALRKLELRISARHMRTALPTRQPELSELRSAPPQGRARNEKRRIRGSDHKDATKRQKLNASGASSSYRDGGI